MAHFAQINSNNEVTQVLVIEQDVVDSGAFGDPKSWVQTSYNTQGGVHTLGGTPLRKNYAGIGHTYDVVRDAFLAPKPYPSYVLNEVTAQWFNPVPYPTDGKTYNWFEPNKVWIEVINH